ncbi:unnamed protein product [Closterium sp. Naga37s-1]|nr:unnamed protein product [Closterium sp. Naga37s-1]
MPPISPAVFLSTAAGASRTAATWLSLAFRCHIPRRPCPSSAPCPPTLRALSAHTARASRDSATVAAASGVSLASRVPRETRSAEAAPARADPRRRGEEAARPGSYSPSEDLRVKPPGVIVSLPEDPRVTVKVAGPSADARRRSYA